MADLTSGQLPEPRRIYGADSIQGAPSNSNGAIGEGLSGLARVADVALTSYEKQKGQELSTGLQDQLTKLVQDNYGATPPQGVVGAPPADARDASAASSPVVQQTNSQLDRLNQAQKQNAMTPTELMTRASVIVQDAINKNPYYADEIRAAAKDVLGTQPTQEMVKLAEQDSADRRAIEQQATLTATQAATRAGITYTNPDGTYDIAKNAEAGRAVLFAEHQLDMTTKQAQLDAAAHPKPTREEQIDAQTQPFLKAVSPVFEHVVGSLLSQSAKMAQQYANLDKPKQIEMVMNGIGSAQAQMMTYVNTLLLKNPNITPDAAEKVRAYFNAPFEQFKGLAAGGNFSYFSNTTAAMTALQAKNKMDFFEAAPALARTDAAGGQQATSAIISQAVGANESAYDSLTRETNNFLLGGKQGGNAGAPPPPSTASVIHTSASALDGTYDLSAEQDPGTQAQVLKGVVATVKSYTQTPNNLGDKEQGAFSTGINQIARLGLKSNDPKNLSIAADTMNDPATMATFDSFAKNPNNANRVALTATAISSLNMKSIQTNVPQLLRGHSITVPTPGSVPFDTSGLSPTVGGTAVEQTTVSAKPYFNPATGRVSFDLVATDERGNKVPVTPQLQAQVAGGFQEYSNQIASVNRSMDAVVHMAPYGIGKEKELQPLEIKQLVTAGSGMPVKDGMQPVPMPKFLSGGPQLDPKIKEAQLKQESGGQSQAELEAKDKASGQGAVGPWQIRPQDYPQYDAKRLRGDTPEDAAYAEKAHDEIMAKLLEKHHGNQAMALAEYHGGPNQRQWGRKTFRYVDAIMSNAGQ